MAKLMGAIGTKETPVARSAFQSVALPFRVISVEHGEAVGCGKGGSASMPVLGGLGGYRHDYNYAWCAEHNGKPVSVCLLTNNLEPSANEFLTQRFASFACESSCNSGFRAQCASMFEQSNVSPLHGMAWNIGIAAVGVGAGMDGKWWQHRARAAEAKTAIEDLNAIKQSWVDRTADVSKDGRSISGIR